MPPRTSGAVLGPLETRDDVEGRVRKLLTPACTPAARITKRGLASLALLVPVAALPLYALVHELIEALVRFGL